MIPANELRFPVIERSDNTRRCSPEPRFVRGKVPGAAYLALGLVAGESAAALGPAGMLDPAIILALLASAWLCVSRFLPAYRWSLFLFVGGALSGGLLVTMRAAPPCAAELSRSERDPIRGVIIAGPELIQPGAARLTLQPAQCPGRLLLTVPYLPWLQSAAIRTGDLVEITAKLRIHPPEKLNNPFLYEAFLARQGIVGTGRIISLKQAASKHAPPPAEKSPQADYLTSVALRFGGSESLAVLLAMTMGEEQLIGPDLDERFKQSGLTHLLVVSGFHVTFMFLFVYRIVLHVLVRIEPLTARCPAQLPACLAAFVGALGYTFLVGATVPIVRAAVALGFVVCGRLLGRKRNEWHSLLAVFIVMIVVWPGCFFEAGCQLTFLALIGLLTAQGYSGQLAGAGWVIVFKRALLFAFAPALLTLSPILCWFGTVVPLAVVYNLLFGAVLTVVYTGGGGVGLALDALGFPGGELLLRGSLYCGGLLLAALEWAVGLAARFGLGVWEPVGGAWLVALILSVTGAAAFIARSPNRQVDVYGRV